MKSSQPPMKKRVIFVQYVCRRLCRNNPSFERFSEVPPEIQRDMLRRMDKREKEARRG